MNDKPREAILGSLGALPCSAILSVKNFCKKHAPRYVPLIEGVQLEKYLTKTDFSALDVKNRPVGHILHGKWDYLFVNVCCIDDMLRRIVLALADGYRPSIEAKDVVTGGNLWEQFFIQPYGIPAAEDPARGGCVYSDREYPALHFPAIPSEEEIRRIGKLFTAFVIPNKEMSAYIEGEYRELLAGARVLGVLSRGTDYKVLKPKSHPIQPKTEDLIALAGEKMRELRCDAIYLATEEKAVEDQFQAAFPGKILTNRRSYMDEFYEKQAADPVSISSINMVVDKEGDARYRKAKEYLSSVFLLSRCNALVAGACGGSRMAAYLNNGKYEYCYFFNLGVY